MKRCMTVAIPKLVAAMLAMLIISSTVQAAEIKLIAANALKEAVLELVPEFEKASGHQVTTIWGGSEGITKRITQGEAVDVVLIAAQNIDRLIGDGKLIKDRTDVAKSG